MLNLCARGCVNNQAIFSQKQNDKNHLSHDLIIICFELVDLGSSYV